MTGFHQHQRQQQQQDEDMIISHSNTKYHPTNPIQIVTWYMSPTNTFSFASLVKLLTTHKLYAHVQKLELIVPTSTVPQEMIDRLANYIRYSERLQEVLLIRVPSRLLSSSDSKTYLKILEKAAHKNDSIDMCHIKEVNVGNVHLLCDSLTATITQGRWLRHLAIDGLLLQGMSRADLTQLAFDVSWDRSIYVALFKDCDNTLLQTILPKLVHGPLHTLKIVNEPICDSKRLQDAPLLNTQPLKEILSSHKLKTLQRLYLGHVRLHAATVQTLLEGMQQNQTVQQLEFALCQLEQPGIARQFAALLKQQPSTTMALRDIQFHYPIVVKKK